MAASAPEDGGPAKDVTRPGLEAAFIAMQQERQLRREQLATPEARAERRRSRTQFRNASHAEALSLGARFADSLRADVWKSVPLRNGEKIERFVGDFGARVSRPEGGPVALVESTVPLQAPEEDGGKAPVELALEDRGGHFEPSHPLVPIRVPKDPEEPVRFEGSGVGMRLSAVRPDAEGVEVADRLAVTDALEDTDLYVTPVARGFETSAVLRSANSPERLELELDLPPGAELVPLEGGAAEVVRDGRSVTTITAPVAWDADKQPVPVDASVEGNRFVIYVPHRERDVHYPLLVDPEFQDHWNWKDFWNQGEDGWVRATNAPGVFDSAYANFPHRWGAGLYIWTQPVWTCCWSYSEWRRYPHGRDTHFPRADVQVSANGAAWTCAYSGIWAARYGRWDSGPFWMCPVDTHHVTMCVVSDCNWDHGAEGSYVAQALSADGGIQRHDSDKGMSSLRRAWTWMWDRQPPEFSGVNRGGTTPWARERSGTVSGPARDFGLGMKYTVLTAPGTSWGNSAGDGRTRDAGCSGMWNSRCPESLGTDWTFSTTEPGLAGVEGRIAIDVRASDIIGRWSSVRWGYMSIDRSAPVITLSGPLKDRENQELPPGTYELRIDARDGDPNGLNAAKRSGVRSVEVTLDGEVVDYRDQTCSDHSCPLGRSWTFDTSAHPGGEHVVVVTAIDQLGHETSKELRFSTGCCARPATSWGTSPVGATGAFGDVNGDGTDDSVVRQNATGTVYVGLSDGTRFSDWQPWGQGPSPPAPWRFEVADVTGDGLEDIWTRNSVTDEVVVMPSDGLSFRPAQSWGSWAYSDTTLADVDGDAIIDIVGRDPANQQVLVGRSTGSSYEPAEVYGSLGAASRVYAGDVDGDGTADLIGHDTQSGQLSVGLSDVSSFEPGTAWGSLDPQLEVRIEDVNGDGAADVVGRSSETGDVRVATSAEDGFRAARGWTNVPATHSFYVTDGTGDGQADATGRNELTGEVLVSVSDAVVPSEPLAEIW
ncbi:MAG TPA: VCBS repeat-containing protein, partial [Thermoleophilaceae bacterium]|nr:VCBS repeat-containing protein [Thermoleophilaceae bacterium]